MVLEKPNPEKGKALRVRVCLCVCVCVRTCKEVEIVCSDEVAVWDPVWGAIADKEAASSEQEVVLVE